MGDACTVMLENWLYEVGDAMSTLAPVNVTDEPSQAGVKYAFTIMIFHIFFTNPIAPIMVSQDSLGIAGPSTRTVSMTVTDEPNWSRATTFKGSAKSLVGSPRGSSNVKP